MQQVVIYRYWSLVKVVVFFLGKPIIANLPVGELLAEVKV